MQFKCGKSHAQVTTKMHTRPFERYVQGISYLEKAVIEVKYGVECEIEVSVRWF